VPNWINAGTIQSVGWTATTTAPTIGTVAQNSYYYRQLGPKTWACKLVYQEITAAGAPGSGDYLITLPGGLQFDTSQADQGFNTSSVGSSAYGLWNTVLAVSHGSITNNANGHILRVIPYNATQFRIVCAGVIGNGGLQCMGSGYYAVAGTPKLILYFEFQAL